MDNRERARARDKKQTRRLENARGRQGEASKVKMGGNEKKKSEQEHKRQNLW